MLSLTRGTVLTKGDLGECKYLAQANQWAQKINAEVYITSSKSGENVQKVFSTSILRVQTLRASVPVAKPAAPKKSGCALV